MDLSTSPNDLVFLDSSLRPAIKVQNALWLRSIALDPEIKRLFDDKLVGAVYSGLPQPADKVLSLLLHWIKNQNDYKAVQQTYAMRLRLQAFLFQYASTTHYVDSYSLGSLGVCSIGRPIAIRLDTSLRLDITAPWICTTLWDWITTMIDDEESVQCTIGVQKPDRRLSLWMRDLQKPVFVVLLNDAYLWPQHFPVMDSVQFAMLTGLRVCA